MQCRFIGDARIPDIMPSDKERMQELKGAIKATEADIIEDLKRQDALIDDYLFFAVGVDAIVVNPQEALNPALPCKCVSVTRESGATEDLCWKKGMIGLIGKDELDAYCPADSRQYPKSAQGMSKRLESFEKASEMCETAGATDLSSRLACMSAALRSQGTVVGQVAP
jgi:hypothetical protein